METSTQKNCSDLLNTNTTVNIFQNMDSTEIMNDTSTFALSIRLQFPKFSKGFSVSDFEEFVKSDIGEDNLVSLGRLAFPNQWQIQVKDTDIREKLIRMGRTRINNRSCWISPLNQSEVRGYIHWLPTAIPNSKLLDILTTHGQVLFLENQKQTKWDGKITGDSRYFGLLLKSGKTMDDVEHFIKVDNYSGFIAIRGRPTACFHCRDVGHRKSECLKFKAKRSSYCARAPKGVKRSARGRRHRTATADAAVAVQEGSDTNKEMVQKSPQKKEETAKDVKTAENLEKQVKSMATGVLDAGLANPCAQLEELRKQLNDFLLDTQNKFAETVQKNLMQQPTRPCAATEPAAEQSIAPPDAKKKKKKKRKKKTATAQTDDVAASKAEPKAED